MPEVISLQFPYAAFRNTTEYHRRLALTINRLCVRAPFAHKPKKSPG